MRDGRNVLHASLAARRKKQKRNRGMGKRVLANLQGVGDPQNRREP